ncbi:hypothetical protein CUN22_09130 [Enterococcus faecalis]|nr:hypothetical protein [Enterococcus faecalis]PQB78496.1 hypothetical protein CUN22_09130 [Enterococcus faecalis]
MAAVEVFRFFIFFNYFIKIMVLFLSNNDKISILWCVIFTHGGILIFMNRLTIILGIVFLVSATKNNKKERVSE